jgi:hypothetical protein
MVGVVDNTIMKKQFTLIYLRQLFPQINQNNNYEKTISTYFTTNSRVNGIFADSGLQ